MTKRRLGLSAMLLCAGLIPPVHAQTNTSIYRGKQVTYRTVNGMAVDQGDIVLGTAAELEAAHTRATTRTTTRTGRELAAAQPTPQAATVAYSANLWTASGGVVHVPYVLRPDTTGTSASAVNTINNAIASFNISFLGIVQWVPRASETDYVNFDLSPANTGGGCVSYVGRIGGVQTITGAINCSQAVLMHEMGHAIGLWHEHTRMDRNAFVSVRANAIDKPNQSNFDQETFNENDLGLYDYASLMHYSAFLFG